MPSLMVVAAGMMQRLEKIAMWPPLVGSLQVWDAEPAAQGSTTTGAPAVEADAAMQSEGSFLREITNLRDVRG